MSESEADRFRREMEGGGDDETSGEDMARIVMVAGWMEEWDGTDASSPELVAAIRGCGMSVRLMIEAGMKGVPAIVTLVMMAWISKSRDSLMEHTRSWARANSKVIEEMYLLILNASRRKKG